MAADAALATARNRRQEGLQKMGNELAILEHEFKPRLPAFANVLAPFRLPVAAFQSGVMAMFEQNSWLLRSCEIQSVINSVMSIAVQGLRLDPATQQACIVPFRKKAQAITMKKGFVVIAARAGFTLQPWAVRDGDHFIERAGGALHDHQPSSDKRGRLVGVYAIAQSKTMPTLTTPLITLDEIIATRDSSKGYQAAKADGKQHPWMTHFDQMALKTAQRLLSKDIPNDMLQMAGWLETQHDLGRVAYLRPDGQGVIDADVEIAETQPGPRTIEASTIEPRRFFVVKANGKIACDTIEQWRSRHELALSKSTPEQAKMGLDLNAGIMDELRDEFPEHVNAVGQAFERRIRG